MSFNSIRKLSGVEAVAASLRTLNASSNFISRISGGDVGSLRLLRHCYLDNNSIASLDDLRTLSALVQLTVLKTCGNPVASEGDYLSVVLSTLPTLRLLDGEDVSSPQQQPQQQQPLHHHHHQEQQAPTSPVQHSDVAAALTLTSPVRSQLEVLGFGVGVAATSGASLSIYDSDWAASTMYARVAVLQQRWAHAVRAAALRCVQGCACVGLG